MQDFFEIDVKVYAGVLILATILYIQPIQVPALKAKGIILRLSPFSLFYHR